MTHDELLTKIDEEIEYNLNQGGVEAGLGASLRAVVELHKPKNAYNVNFCLACSPMGYAIFYPCPTIQAIEKELNG